MFLLRIGGKEREFMARIELTGEQRKEMWKAVRSGKGRWRMLTRRERKEALELREHKKKLTEEQKKVGEMRRVPLTCRQHVQKWVFMLLCIAAVYAYLRYIQRWDLLIKYDPITWIKGLISGVR